VQQNIAWQYSQYVFFTKIDMIAALESPPTRFRRLAMSSNFLANFAGGMRASQSILFLLLGAWLIFFALRIYYKHNKRLLRLSDTCSIFEAIYLFFYCYQVRLHEGIFTLALLYVLL
jgi:hypothetical protein